MHSLVSTKELPKQHLLAQKLKERPPQDVGPPAKLVRRNHKVYERPSRQAKAKAHGSSQAHGSRANTVPQAKVSPPSYATLTPVNFKTSHFLTVLE